MEMFASNMGVKVIRADAQERFLSRLAGVSEPEAKRKLLVTRLSMFSMRSRKADRG